MSNVVTEETVTTFYFIVNSLIDKVNTHVLYKVRKRDDILGLDQNSVIDAELLIKEYLHSASAELFNKWISPLSRELEDLDDPQVAFVFNDTFTHPETEEETENCIIFRVIFPEKFDTTTKPVILRAIEDVLVSYAVYNWLMDSNIQDWQKYELEYLRKIDNLSGLLTRRINLKRSYKLY